jgi:hypothetical protein
VKGQSFRFPAPRRWIALAEAVGHRAVRACLHPFRTLLDLRPEQSVVIQTASDPPTARSRLNPRVRAVLAAFSSGCVSAASSPRGSDWAGVSPRLLGSDLGLRRCLGIPRRPVEAAQHRHQLIPRGSRGGFPAPPDVGCLSIILIRDRHVVGGQGKPAKKCPEA